MLSINDDVLVKISEFLFDADKIAWSATCMLMGRLRHKFIYHECITVRIIKHLSYFDRFENVAITNAKDRYPKRAKFIHFCADNTDIPYGITHLSFDYGFNQPINDCIPTTVTHLKFGIDFDQPINGNIPSSVISITFGSCFDQSLRYLPLTISKLFINVQNMKEIYIPSSVKTLSLRSLDTKIKRCIPSTVTKLKLYDNTTFIVWCLPLFSSVSGVTRMTFPTNFINPIPGLIPSTVTHLKFGGNFWGSINGCIPKSVIEIRILNKNYNVWIDNEITSRVKIII